MAIIKGKHLLVVAAVIYLHTSVLLYQHLTKYKANFKQASLFTGASYSLRTEFGVVGLEYLSSCKCWSQTVSKDTSLTAEKTAACHIRNISSVANDLDADDFLDKIDLSYPENVWVHNGWLQQLDSSPDVINDVLQVLVVPFSHVDAGWKFGFEEYTSLTSNILDNAVKHLSSYPNRTFVFGETSFLKHWYRRMPLSIQQSFKSILQSGKLEIVEGGWIMPDQALVHYEAFLEELTYGHQWLFQTLNYTTSTAWSLDAFGLSSTFPLLLKCAGFERYFAQRSHFAIKKFLAKKHQLDFHWQPKWERGLKTDPPASLLTHLSPFMLYNIPYSCGPDYAVCCQFDFHNGKCWSWGKYTPPEEITDKNIHYKAKSLVEQWRKKAGYSGHNVVLHLHGDDFRYTTEKEWQQQLSNMAKLIEFINRTPEFRAKVKFAVVSDYFKALEKSTTKPLPTLGGDMLVYSDRGDQYWSGYYTSRPVLKAMIRLFQSKVRSADLLMNFAATIAEQHGWVEAKSQLSTMYTNLLKCREMSGLMQHHDAITGTAKAKVVADYLNKIYTQLQSLDEIFSTALSVLLLSHSPQVLSELQKGRKTLPIVLNMFETKTQRSMPQLRPVILHRPESKSVMVFFNSLPYDRQEIVEIETNFRHVLVTTSDGEEVLACQIEPVLDADYMEKPSLFKISFLLNQPAMSVTTVVIKRLADLDFTEGKCMPAELEIFTNEHIHSKTPSVFHRTVSSLTDVHIQGSTFTLELCRCSGLLNSVTVEGVKYKLQQRFAFYTTGQWYKPLGDKSGAYIFLPTGEPYVFQMQEPTVVVVKGPVVTKAHTFISKNLRQTVTLYSSDGDFPLSCGIFLETEVNLSKLNNTEIAVRFDTDVFDQGEEPSIYVDVNGFQTARRQLNRRLPLQGNFHPMTTHVFLQSKTDRFTVLSTHSHGVTSSQQGQLDIMLDRRLSQDDWRGLNEGVLDNTHITSKFVLLVEPALQPQEIKKDKPQSLSVNSHLISNFINHPLIVQTLVTSAMEKRAVFPVSQKLPPSTIPLLTTSSWPRSVKLLNFKDVGQTLFDKQSKLMTVHRTFLDCNYEDSFDYKELDAVDLCEFMETLDVQSVETVPLTGVGRSTKIDRMFIQPMDVQSYYIKYSVKQEDREPEV